MRPDTARKSGLAAAVLSAVAASACCVGPLVFATLGLGGAGVLVAMEPLRPLFAFVTVSVLVVGFYVTYRPRVADGEDCGCERPRTHRTGRWMLWATTAFAVLALVSPTLIAASAGAAEEPPAEEGVALATATFKIEGMTCASCEGSIRKVVSRLDGVNSVTVSFADATATVRYDPDGVTASTIAAAITDLGYTARVVAAGGE